MLKYVNYWFMLVDNDVYCEHLAAYVVALLTRCVL